MGIIPTKAEIPKDAADYPVAKAFAVRDPEGFGSESVQKFYDTLSKIERYHRTQKMLKDSGRLKEWNEYKKKHPIEQRVNSEDLEPKSKKLNTLATEFRRVRNDLSSLRKIINQTLESKTISVEQKKRIREETERLVMVKVIEILSKYSAIEAQIK